MSTTEFTVDDLRRILTEGAGETAHLDGDILDVTFDDLGYDSLAMLETGSRVDREYGLQLDEESVGEVQTPRQLISLVNEALAESAA